MHFESFISQRLLLLALYEKAKQLIQLPPKELSVMIKIKRELVSLLEEYRNVEVYYVPIIKKEAEAGKNAFGINALYEQVMATLKEVESVIATGYEERRRKADVRLQMLLGVLSALNASVIFMSLFPLYAFYLFIIIIIILTIVIIRIIYS